MSKPVFTVIEGGLVSEIRDKPKHLVTAYVTNTRLMGVLAVYARWYIARTESEDGTLHQFFYIDCEETGLETYKGLWGKDASSVEEVEQALVGGLGAKKIELTERQLRALMCKYKGFNEKRGLSFPKGREEYDFMFEPEVVLNEDEDRELMSLICDKITTDNQVINYFLMRCFGRDYEGARYLAPVRTPNADDEGKARPLDADFPLDLYDSYVKTTFCKNTIDVEKKYADGGVAYLCESLVEMNGSYDLIISKVVVRDLKVIGFEHCSGFHVSASEAAMMLAKPEYCTVYEVLLSEEDLDRNIGEFTINFNTIMSTHENGRLFMAFKQNNDHVNERIFMLSNDVQGIYYLTDFGQLIVAAYSIDDVRCLEDTMAKSFLAPYLEVTGKYEFRESLIFEFIKSSFEDFDDFLDFLGV